MYEGRVAGVNLVKQTLRVAFEVEEGEESDEEEVDYLSTDLAWIQAPVAAAASPSGKQTSPSSPAKADSEPSDKLRGTTY